MRCEAAHGMGDPGCWWFGVSGDGLAAALLETKGHVHGRAHANGFALSLYRLIDPLKNAFLGCRI